MRVPDLVRRAGLATLLLPTALLVGCGAGGDGGADGGEGAPTLEAPPELRVGDWWEVEVAPTLVGATLPATLVVTHVEEGRARIGITPETLTHDFLVLHVPVLGDVELATFAWRVMWDDFAALRFPLEVGRRWSADFHGNDVEAEVTRIEGDRAHVTLTGEGERIELVYDAGARMITEFSEEALLLNFRVVDHGRGYVGEVLSMAGIELGLMQGGPAETPGSSTETLEVTSPGSHGSLSLVVWNRGFEDEAGSYRIAATAPDGTVFEHQFETAPGDPSVLVTSFGHDAVQGAWQIDFERGGPARLLVELFTYDLETMRSPP